MSVTCCDHGTNDLIYERENSQVEQGYTNPKTTIIKTNPRLL